MNDCIPNDVPMSSATTSFNKKSVNTTILCVYLHYNQATHFETTVPTSGRLVNKLKFVY